MKASTNYESFQINWGMKSEKKAKEVAEMMKKHEEQKRDLKINVLIDIMSLIFHGDSPINSHLLSLEI